MGDDQHTLIDADATDDLPLDAGIGDRTRARELTSRAEDERAITRLDEARARGAAEGEDGGRGEGITRGDFDDIVGATEGNRTSRRKGTGDTEARWLDGRAIGGSSDRPIEDDGVGGVAKTSIGRDDERAAGDGDVPRKRVRAIEDEATGASLGQRTRAGDTTTDREDTAITRIGDGGATDRDDTITREGHGTRAEVQVARARESEITGPSLSGIRGDHDRVNGRVVERGRETEDGGTRAQRQGARTQRTGAIDVESTVGRDGDPAG